MNNLESNKCCHLWQSIFAACQRSFFLSMHVCCSFTCKQEGWAGFLEHWILEKNSGSAMIVTCTTTFCAWSIFFTLKIISLLIKFPSKQSMEFHASYIWSDNHTHTHNMGGRNKTCASRLSARLKVPPSPSKQNIRRRACTISHIGHCKEQEHIQRRPWLQGTIKCTSREIQPKQVKHKKKSAHHYTDTEAIAVLVKQIQFMFNPNLLS